MSGRCVRRAAHSQRGCHDWRRCVEARFIAPRTYGFGRDGSRRRCLFTGGEQDKAEEAGKTYESGTIP